LVKPKKHLGQHFLHDENIARKIVASLTGGCRTLVEIGPGTGVLTKYLLQDKNFDPYFYEIDRESVEYLHTKYPEIGERLREADFLEADLSQIPAPFAVIGNFPYNISSQILFKALENRERIPEVLGMFQKEVAERIASPPGSKKYGILSVLVQTWYSVEYLFTVNETVFIPPPKVKSAVIRLRRREGVDPVPDPAAFFAVVKAAFNQRRKTLRNSLKKFSFGEDPSLASLFTKRAEQLTKEEFLRLTAAVVR
jgi:16S rRNA (adenine1518-N6/adenine1519-N6)-dimethyltransferase